jgi:ABC-type transport system substrate-binding protein
VNRNFQLLFIAVVIILILVGEAVVYVPTRPAGLSVAIKSYPSTNALVQALSNDEVDLAPIENIAPQTLLQLKSDSNLNIIPISNFGFTYIGLNLRNAPLNNPVFREAMLYGFDRERVLNGVLAGYGEALSPGLFSSAYAALGWRNESISSYPYDPTRASELLDSIGYTQSSTGVRIDPSTGQQLRTMFIFSKLTDPQAVAAANMFAEDMQAIGLPIISFPESNIDFYSQTSVTYYFDIYIETVTANAAPTWLYNLFDGANDVSPAPLSTNLMGYNNSTFNQWAKQLMTASDSDAAKAAALSCQGQLSLDLPALPVYSKNLLLVEQKSFLDITPITGSIADTIAASLENTTSGAVTIGEVGGLSDINPADALGTADSLALRLITTPIMTHTSNGSPEPGLIDRWQMTNNATNLTLDLGQGSKFQSGSATTAQDLSATLNWLVTNVLPSAPLYSVLKTIRNAAAVDPYTVSISLSQSNYFFAYEIGDLFALPANSLPQQSEPLALLLSGALQSSGPYVLTRFVQGAEVDLQSATQNGEAGLLTISGVQGQDVFGTSVGGSEVRILSQPLTYGGQYIANATLAASIEDGNGTTEIPGVYAGFGIYQAFLNLNEIGLSLGNHVVTTELYGQLPSGIIVQFNQQNLVVNPSLFLGQIVLWLLAVVAVGYVGYAAIRGRRRALPRRVRRRARRTPVRRSRKRT